MFIVLSNEKSSNYWNILWKWLDINHQYSKSLEFELDFSLYVKKYISSNIKYFSLLRWMYEIKIAELFTKYASDYFWYFSSCNKNFSISTKKLTNKYWCNSCSKCVFVFIILSAFLNDEEIIKIFWENLYFKNDLKDIYYDLLWFWKTKPFECVWEKIEVIYAMYKYLKNRENNLDKYIDKSAILKEFKHNILCKFSEEDILYLEKKLFYYYSSNNIPKIFECKIKDLF